MWDIRPVEQPGQVSHMMSTDIAHDVHRQSTTPMLFRSGSMRGGAGVCERREPQPNKGRHPRATIDTPGLDPLCDRALR